MRRIGFELTDRCNLACAHCLRETNADKRNLPAADAERAFADAALLGFEEAIFTGGEPTLHPAFGRLVRGAVAAGLRVVIVTNGQRPAPLWEVFRDAGVCASAVVSLSLEAADEAAFEAVRGPRTYRRFMTTLAGLQARGVAVRFSATVGPWNRRQWPRILSLAAQLGVREVSVACYQPADRAIDENLTIRELAELHAFIEGASAAAAVAVTLAYEPITARATHLCATLALNELNVNHRGEVTFCCQLSTLHHAAYPEAVVVGRLSDGLPSLIGAQARNVAAFLEAKAYAWRDGAPAEGDHNPCAYCLRVFGQVARHGVRHAA